MKKKLIFLMVLIACTGSLFGSQVKAAETKNYDSKGVTDFFGTYEYPKETPASSDTDETRDKNGWGQSGNETNQRKQLMIIPRTGDQPIIMNILLSSLLFVLSAVLVLCKKKRNVYK
ncbi:LPXTG cell wall anchor domain-containing protein [Vagococcus entomophilus]|uniref:Gram-positive cocci surface proteins LPxTG domain-containing protein n=1 Tax=Vagococcus entomophilus TaxID=1160095 RepID=A0A430AKG7_9ENTE|nr:LPXTG cell wall anchor domain-containing protein [Vagococcus entomophilus]RSU08586.1 hypothetical protein CBF30_04975 [Vagococcus entomophilus]